MKVEAILSFRALWYSVVIWLLALVVSGVVIVPWFYAVMTAVVSLLTIYYFRLIVPLKIKRGRKKMAERDHVFIFGLVAAICWFLVLLLLNFLEIVGFYYFDFSHYFSDFRNWYLYALILLVPVIYALIVETKVKSRRRNFYKPKVV